MTTDEFRAKADPWLKANAKPFAETGDQQGREGPLDESKAFMKRLHAAGFAGITYPTEYGGQGLSPAEQAAWNELVADYDLPIGVFTIGQGMPAPTILALGTEEQKRRYLPKLLSGEEVWCQLFSEPDGGSDVASLQTSATRTETGWVLNGQKVWTTVAQHADYGAIIARTDPTVPKHAGITMFIVDMHDPGVTVRPLKVATGTSPFNEVFFDGVPLPADAVLGEVDNGWHATVTMLNFERIMIGTGGRRRANPLGYDNLAKLVTERGLNSDTHVRRRLAEVYAREMSLDAFGQFLNADSAAGNPIGARGSAAKLAGAEYGLWASTVVQDIFGLDLAAGDNSLNAVLMAVMSQSGMSTAGGTNEIQRNIVAERVLGLPKDPGVDKSIPFNKIKFSR
ncbi:MAG: acd [Amycolatopsis sp.]|uniref:acyl-CoA dehydrogenase family protein n=1 Tax=Amycolatopsis sp. TaxID=37632 RepID=UPI00261AC389|nr:acyl-CoA dehydrogenase family protein [Amycolatopsis sp.]MCU1684042.1 acd [Amycolatopsis sp.]